MAKGLWDIYLLDVLAIIKIMFMGGGLWLIKLLEKQRLPFFPFSKEGEVTIVPP